MSGLARGGIGRTSGWRDGHSAANGHGGNGQGGGHAGAAGERSTPLRSRAYDWMTTTDHKKIGILYIVTAFFFFLVGGLLAELIRAELASPGLQFVNDETYNQLFTMHGTIMIFLFVMPMFSGFANYLVPLMIGAPDVAFPRINALSFWMVPVAGLIMLVGLPDQGRRGGGRLDRLRAAVRAERAARPEGPGPVDRGR